MPYNEFGEYIPDDLALDEMRYELASKGRMPLRPGGSDVPYVASEVPQTYVAKPPPRPASTATNVPQAIADRLGLSAIPQAALGMLSSFPAAVAKETGFPDVAEAIQYTPTSKMGYEVLEGVSRLPQVVTGSEMGVGPLAEFYVPRRGFGLQSRPLLSPDDVRVMGGRAIETGRELRNVPEDFRAAQEGLRRESVFGGPTIGARTQGIFDEIGDVMARREMQGLSPIPGIPDVVSPETRMYAVRRANVGQMIDPTDLPTARYSDQNRKINTVSNMLNDVVPFTDFEYPHNNSTEYYNAAVRDAPSDMTEAWKTFSQKKYNEMFPDAPNDAAAVEAFGNRFDQRSFALTNIEMLSEFARSPEALSAVEAIANRRDTLLGVYNEAKNKPKKDIPEDQRQAHEENVEKLELAMLKEDLMPELSRKEFIERITPPTKEEYIRRAQAAKDYIQGTFKKDISKYIGTSQGPQMELAKRGITMAPKAELLDMMTRFESPRGAFRGELDDLGRERAKAGFNPKGEMYPLIVQKETEVKDLQVQLNDLNRQKSELRDLHRAEMPDEPDAARNPTETGAKYRALTNPMNTLIDKIEQTKKQLENFTLANAYETISDVAYTPVFAKTFKQNIPYPEKQFFPNLEKTPNEAQMFNVKSRELGELGIPFLAEMIVKNIMTGRIPLDEKGKPMTSIDKSVEQLTKPRLKEESIEDAEKRKGMVQLNEFAQETLSKIPPDLRFKNASAFELTKDSTESAIRRQTSFDGMVLDHCIAGCDAPHPGVNPFSGERYSYSYPVDPATGKDRGDKKLSSSYMSKVLKGSERMTSLRDNVTGLPSVTINMEKTSGSATDIPKYNLVFVSGYKNDQIDKKYTEDVRDYLNLRSDIIKGSGNSLGKWGILDTQSNDGQRKLASLLKIETTTADLGLPRFVLENDIRKMALEQPMGDTHADMVGRRTLLNDEYNRLVRERGENDPEVQDLGSQIANITQRLHTISRQTVTQASDRPNLFRRMSSEALTNGLQLEGRLDEVLDLVSRTTNLLNDNGLVDFWADDLEFFPEKLRTFTNAIRNDENLSRAMGEGYNPQEYERLARFQLAIRDYTPHQREVLVRELDRYGEANILQQIANLNPDDAGEGQRQYEEEHPGVADYLEQISRRRRGEDFTPEAAPSEAGARFDAIARIISNGDRSVSAELQGLSRRHGIESPEFADALRARINEFAPGDVRRNSLIDALSAWQSAGRPALQAPISVPRDIANQVVPMNQAFRDQTVQEVTEAINNSIRNLPEDRETLQEALAQYQRNPLDIPGSIEMILPTSPALEVQNENRRTISNYLIQQIQNRLGNQAPAQNIELGNNVLRMIDQNREAIAAAYPDLLNSFETVHNSAQNHAVMAARRNENPNEAYVNEVGRQLRNLSRGRQTEERVALIPLVQSFYDDLLRFGQIRETTRAELERQFAQADTNEEATRIQAQINQMDAANQLMPEHVRGVITRDLNEMMMLGELNRAGSVLNRIFEGDGAFGTLTTDEQRTAASDFFNSTLRRLLNDPDYRPAGGQPVPEAQFDRSIIGYRDQFTNPLTGSRRAFDEVIQAERITPGAINEAILRTDGDARYDEAIRDFYRVDSPAGISQLNNALRRYMEGNGFDVPPRQVTTQETLSNIFDEALETASNNYPDNIVDSMQRDLDTIMTEGVRFDTNPDEFILRLNQLAREAGETGLEGDATYATAMNELASSLLYDYQQLPDTPGAAPQLPAPAANPIDELERRYGNTPRAPIDIVTDGLNRPITQFERDYSEEVQDAYRQVLNEITPAPTLANLQEAMSHLSIIHDMLEGGEHDPAEFNLTTAREMTDLSNLIERHFEVFREFENVLDNTEEQAPDYTPIFGQVRVYESPRNQTVYHSTDANSPVISTSENRLIPNSLSASRNRSTVWGRNVFPIAIPRGTTIGELNSIFDILPNGVEDTPRNIGIYLRDYAERRGIDVLKIRNVQGVGIEYVILNPNLLPNQPPQGRKRGGFIERATGFRSYSDLMREKFNRKYYDDGQAALDFELRTNMGSDQLGTSPRKYPDYSDADIVAPKRNEFLNFNQDLKRGGLLRMNKGSRVSPVPTATRLPSDHPHTPPVKPVVNLTDPGFAEELKYQIEQRQKSSSRPSGGGGTLTDAEMKNRLGSRNPTYNAGGKVSIDQMRYELLRK